jgi:50S ribosomal protein L16 3-hydroxylase
VRKTHADTVLGMPEARFLRRYWQREPLLIRQAFPGFASPLSPDDLAGFACEPLASSRLIVHEPKRDRWTVKHGPLAEADFARLPKRHWTLLVQDVDKLVDDVAALRDAFRFVPQWRVDDVMVSYAVDGGSVGAHVDRYDVFLLQGAGRRRWLIDANTPPEPGFRDDAELKLLREFRPTHDWVLEPGDMLYLPPGVAHHGIAVDECLTYSVGMRAPSAAELILDLAEDTAERLGDAVRYGDAELAPQRDDAEIDATAFARVAALLREAQSLDEAALRHWFAGFVTRYRTAHEPMPPRRAVPPERLERALARGGALVRNPWSRYAFVREGRGAALYFAGQRVRGSLRLARLLQDHRRYDAALVASLDATDRAVLFELVNHGHLGVSR